MSETLKPGLDFSQLPEEVKARRREIAAFHQRVHELTHPIDAIGGWRGVARALFTDQETGQIDVIKGSGRVVRLGLMLPFLAAREYLKEAERASRPNINAQMMQYRQSRKW